MSPRLDIEHDGGEEMRDEPRRARQGVRAAVLAVVVAALVGGSWWAGHRSSPATQDVSVVPEIHPDNAPVKEPPKDPGGLVVPDQDSVLLNHDARNAKARPEELLPPPEAVKPRPAPPPTAVAAPTSPPAPLPPAASAPPPAAAAPQVATAPPTPVMPAKPAAPKAAAPTPAPKVVSPSQPPAAGSYRLQLGALKTEAAARTEWLRLQRQNSDLLGKLSLLVSPVGLGVKGTYYRIQAGPIADEQKAAQDCAALKSRKVACILVKP